MTTKNWAPQQTTIFKWYEKDPSVYTTRHLVIRARAGTGKTTTNIEGVNRAPEGKILLAAFNKRIAVELEQRIENPNAEAKTLHSLGFGFVRAQWHKVGVDDSGERGLRLATEACGKDAPDDIIYMVQKLATLAKEMRPFADKENDLRDLAEEFDLVPDDEFIEQGWTYAKVEQATMKAMELATHKDDKIDFSDMLFIPVRNKFVKARWDLVVVDEAQDMNYTQLVLATKCCKPDGRIVVVGDDRQAIYGFRGADSGSLDRLKAGLKAQELPLTTTYRCPKTVVQLAKAIVPDFEAAPSAPDGEVKDIPIESLVGNVKPGDFVLSRKNAPLVRFCLKFLRAGIRAKVEGKDVGRGLVALTKKMGKAKSIKDFIVRVKKWQTRECDKWMAAGKEAKAGEVTDKAETLIELCEGLASVPEIVGRINALFADGANKEPQVVLSTVHKAKGLESNHVYLLESSFKVKTMTPEEHNIRYVAITRAKQVLFRVVGSLEGV